MMTRELEITVYVTHPFPCNLPPLVVLGLVSNDPSTWRASATVNCPCGNADVRDVTVRERRRQVRQAAPND